jgi:hypothetical protein
MSSEPRMQTDQQALTLIPEGTVLHYAGTPVRLVNSAIVATHPNNQRMLVGHAIAFVPADVPPTEALS